MTLMEVVIALTGNNQDYPIVYIYKHPPRCCNNEACTGDRLGGGRDFEGDKADKPESSIRCQDCMKRKNIERIAKLLYSDFYARWVDHGQVSRSEGWVDEVSGWVGMGQGTKWKGGKQCQNLKDY